MGLDRVVSWGLGQAAGWRVEFYFSELLETDLYHETFNVSVDGDRFLSLDGKRLESETYRILAVLRK
jgi:hypothetical protein